jgi:hypothetical protein
MRVGRLNLSAMSLPVQLMVNDVDVLQDFLPVVSALPAQEAIIKTGRVLAAELVRPECCQVAPAPSKLPICHPVLFDELASPSVCSKCSGSASV